MKNSINGPKKKALWMKKFCRGDILLIARNQLIRRNYNVLKRITTLLYRNLINTLSSVDWFRTKAHLNPGYITWKNYITTWSLMMSDRCFLSWRVSSVRYLISRYWFRWFWGRFWITSKGAILQGHQSAALTAYTLIVGVKRWNRSAHIIWYH